jgi:hypothetical protein
VAQLDVALTQKNTQAIGKIHPAVLLAIKMAAKISDNL